MCLITDCDRPSAGDLDSGYCVAHTYDAWLRGEFVPQPIRSVNPIVRNRRLDSKWVNRGVTVDYTVRAVMESRNWECALCRHQIDPYGAGGDAPSVDHIVPQSLGGDDSFANVQPAHQSCNSSKGNRPWREVLYLNAS